MECCYYDAYKYRLMHGLMHISEEPHPNFFLLPSFLSKDSKQDLFLVIGPLSIVTTLYSHSQTQVGRLHFCHIYFKLGKGWFLARGSCPGAYCKFDKPQH